MAWRLVWVCMMVPALAGCMGQPAGPKDGRPRAAAYTELCRGEGRVVELRPEEFGLVLKTEKGPRFAWWDEGSLFLQDNEILRHYAPQVGDILWYQGVESYGEIYMRRVRYLGHKD